MNDPSYFLRLCCLFLLCFGLACSPKETPIVSTQVLVVGGGAGGTAAAIQAARSGAQVILVEETPWLGGMMTAAGVSATDGNHRLPSGLWGEFREHLYDHYGGPEAIFTGWVSNTQFEPSVGQKILHEMAEAEPNLTRYHGYVLHSVQRVENRILGATFWNESGDSLKVAADITIEATELGDVLGLGNVPHWIGQDEPGQAHNPHLQDLTYAAILQEYPEGTTHLLEQPANYDPSEFACFCLELCPDGSGEKLDCQKVLDYAKLPNGKYMLNWPRRGNDYYVDATQLSYAERQAEYEKAKARTLGLVYFLQTEVGFSHIGLATEEFPTADHLPLIPYHREARRVQGLARLEVADLIAPYDPARPPLYREAIAVGDYPLDHHHDKNSAAEAETYPPIPSFSIPYSALVPATVDGLLVAEKSASVSHMVNGASRLQPCVLLTGQAAGAAAAVAVQQSREPREVPIQDLQTELLAANCWLLPWLDTQPSDWFFASAQRVGVRGWMRGHGVPNAWANQTWFYPDSAVRVCEFPEIMLDETDAAEIRPQSMIPCEGRKPVYLSRAEVVLQIWQLVGQPTEDAALPFTDVGNSRGQLLSALQFFQVQGWLRHWAEGKTFQGNEPLTRKELAWLLDQVFGRDFGEGLM